MTSQPSYRTERLNDSNIKDVKSLYEEIFGYHISMDVLTKKYDTSYTGIKHVTFLAYDGEKPIAFYGSLPQRMNYNGESILAVFTCDSLTLPAYQRKGLHKMLALKAYELMRSEGVRFVYAFHSENTFYSCKKLDWELAYSMKGFSIMVVNIPIAKAIRKIRPLAKYYDKYVRNFLKPFQIDSGQFQNSNANARLYQDYNDGFFGYKCFSNNLIIELENVKFWVCITNRVSVGDVNFESEQDLLKGIAKLKKLTFKIGLNEILFQTTIGTKIEKALSKNFTSFESWKVGYYLFDKDIEIDQLRVNYSDFDTF